MLRTASCSSEEEVLQTTVVQGRVINKHTAQPVAGVPVVVRRFSSGGFINPDVSSTDSITGAVTDAAGKYTLSFGTKKTGSYEVGLARFDQLYDLDRGYDGRFVAQRGITNKLNFNVTPYKTVTVNINTSKGGKMGIHIYCSAEPLNYFAAAIFSDTTRANQTISLTRTVRLLPNQQYRFWKKTYNRVPIGNGNFDFRDYTYTSFSRKIGYNDTTVVPLN